MACFLRLYIDCENTPVKKQPKRLATERSSVANLEADYSGEKKYCAIAAKPQAVSR